MFKLAIIVVWLSGVSIATAGTSYFFKWRSHVDRLLSNVSAPNLIVGDANASVLVLNKDPAPKNKRAISNANPQLEPTNAKLHTTIDRRQPISEDVAVPIEGKIELPRSDVSSKSTKAADPTVSPVVKTIEKQSPRDTGTKESIPSIPKAEQAPDVEANESSPGSAKSTMVSKGAKPPKVTLVKPAQVAPITIEPKPKIESEDRIAKTNVGEVRELGDRKEVPKDGVPKPVDLKKTPAAIEDLNDQNASLEKKSEQAGAPKREPTTILSQSKETSPASPGPDESKKSEISIASKLEKSSDLIKAPKGHSETVVLDEEKTEIASVEDDVQISTNPKTVNLTKIKLDMVLKPADPETSVVNIKRGDNLWNIAKKKFGSGFEYPRIFEANRDQIKNPDLIYPGQKFRIPPMDGAKDTASADE